MARRVVAYLVLTACVAGVLYLLRSPAVEVRLVVDLAGTRTLDGLPLRHVEVTVLDAEGRYVASTEHSFPAALHPAGPPAETPAVPMGLRCAEYELQLKLSYGDAEPAPATTRRLLIQVQQEGLLRVSGMGPGG